MRVQSVIPSADKADVRDPTHARARCFLRTWITDMEQPHPSASPSAANPAEPVRSHEDVLALIADVETQISRLRNVQAMSAEDVMQLEQRGRQIAEREQAIHQAEALLTGREAQLRSMSDA